MALNTSPTDTTPDGFTPEFAAENATLERARRGIASVTMARALRAQPNGPAVKFTINEGRIEVRVGGKPIPSECQTLAVSAFATVADRFERALYRLVEAGALPEAPRFVMPESGEPVDTKFNTGAGPLDTVEPSAKDAG